MAHSFAGRICRLTFAHSSTGKLRFSVPAAVSYYNASFSASEYGPYCLQIPEIVPGAPATANVTQSEDCLTINVIRPAGYENKTLPVLAVSPSVSLIVDSLMIVLCSGSLGEASMRVAQQRMLAFILKKA